MSNFYIVPITSQIINGASASAPKYDSFDTPALYMDFTCVPYGAEGVGLLNLSAPNPSLTAQPDVYSFPEDLTQVLDDAAVTDLAAFLASINAPSSWLLAGMSFAEVVRTVATIFLVAQALYGSTGQTLFPAGSGITLDSTVASQSLGKGVHGSGGTTLSAVQIAAGSTAGVFDLTAVGDDPSQTISEVLFITAQQWGVAPILVGGSTI